jgi:hypothetical protein
MDVQSFVVAAIVAALLLADRLGGQDATARRLYQVALGFALAFTVTSATVAFLRSSSPSFTDLIGTGSADFGRSLSGNSGNSTRDAASVRAGLGLLFLLIGFVTLPRLNTVALAFVFAGVLLLFVGGGVSGSFDLNSLTSNALFGSIFGAAKKAHDVAHFVVMLVGTLALLMLGWVKWERAEFRQTSAPA